MKCRICQAESDLDPNQGLCQACREKLQSAAFDSKVLAEKAGEQPAPQIPETGRHGPRGARGRELWQSTAAGGAQCVWPISVAVHPSKDILVLDEPEEYRILRLDKQGRCTEVLIEIPAEDVEGGVEDPQDLCVDSAGGIYVSDAANDRISVWDSQGKFSHWIGDAGSQLGQFAHPGGVEVDSDGFLYVADTFNHRVQKLSADGLVSLEVEDLGSWGRFRMPVAVTMDAEGNLYVADVELKLVIKLSPDGSPLQSLPPAGNKQRLFEAPHDVRVGADGAWHVSDSRNTRIRRFRPDGTLSGVIDLAPSGKEGSDGGDIALLDGGVLVVDRLKDRVVYMEFETVEREAGS
ncbi:MAG: hypothetical protein A2V98_05765 [Planctomycetes bacterium RBG_16_64_12]|nr:MAG: hypothetical protein A2V98_05765 [Planctomycetes bacterium RBG_16_64_12]